MSSLRLVISAFLVTVMPLGPSASHPDAPGYDPEGDTVWIMGVGIQHEPVPDKPPQPPKDENKKPGASLDRNRGPFERPDPEQVS